MGMSIGKDTSDENAPMNEINTTPLVDVMLVLLIMLPLIHIGRCRRAPVCRPTGTPVPNTTKPENV